MEFYIPFFEYPKIKEHYYIKSWKVVDPDRSMRTGDVLLFSGSSFMSSVVKIFTRSRWNHIGMVCWCELEYYNGIKEIDLFTFELGSQPYADLMTGEDANREVRLVRLADVLGMYDILAVRKLNSVRRTNLEKSEWCNKFTAFMWKWKKTPFFDFPILLKTQFVVPGAPDDQTTCSQITARMFDHMGIYELNFDPSQLSPDDYAGHSRVFPKEVFLGEEKIIYRDTKLINARMIFILIVLIIIIAVLVYLTVKIIRRKQKRP